MMLGQRYIKESTNVVSLESESDDVEPVTMQYIFQEFLGITMLLLRPIGLPKASHTTLNLRRFHRQLPKD